MITVKLKGGLGNQLFQYALGKNLAIRNKTELCLDLSVYYNNFQKHDYTLRGYELGVFKINTKLILPPKIPILPQIIAKRLSNVIHKTSVASSKKVIVEKNFRFDSEVLYSGDNSYLNGYWHSEKYFKEIAPDLRKDLILKEKLSQPAENIKNNIRNSKSISLHIRRGDYLTNSWAQKTYCQLPLSYYQEAVEVIQEKEERMKCFIFSDDPTWVKDNIKLPNDLIFITGNKNYEDLYLMSLCTHNVIANSSFSWWGAWLNENPFKKIIAPKQWFKDDKVETKDLIPEEWKQI
jgi:hypothetical protein